MSYGHSIFLVSLSSNEMMKHPLEDCVTGYPGFPNNIFYPLSISRAAAALSLFYSGKKNSRGTERKSSSFAFFIFIQSNLFNNVRTPIPTREKTKAGVTTNSKKSKYQSYIKYQNTLSHCRIVPLSKKLNFRESEKSENKPEQPGAQPPKFSHSLILMFDF